MGWLWSSSPQDTASGKEGAEYEKRTPAESGPKRDFSLSDQQRARIFGGFGSSKQDSGRKSSREVDEDAELEALLRAFVAPEATEASPPSTAKPSELVQEVAPLPTKYDRVLADGSLNIAPAALHPATMSCREAFDQAFYCQSLGGKFNDIYRFGHLKDCSEQWGAFWFCMRTRTLPARDKEVQIREYYQQRDERRWKENKGSSEDVWELRTTAVQHAFQKDPDADEHEMQMKE